MVELYYGTEEFAVTEFQNRKVMDEIKMSMSAFDCMLPDDAAIYCSSDITTGKRFYYEVLKQHEAWSEEELREKLTAEEFKRVQSDLIQTNVERGVKFAEKLRERGEINVVTPGPYFAKGFDQQHYLYLWEWFIMKKVYEIRFNCDWEFSNGCTFEYAIAAKKRVPRLDHEGNSLDLQQAIERIQIAADELATAGFAIGRLKQHLGFLRAIRSS